MQNNNKNNYDCQTVIVFSVYVIWCRKTDMAYVGVTRRKVIYRIHEHMSRNEQYIDQEIQRIGWNGNFDWWIVEEIAHISEKIRGERNPNYGKKMSEEQKEKISKSKCGTPAWNKGIPCSEEMKARISITKYRQYAMKKILETVIDVLKSLDN